MLVISKHRKRHRHARRAVAAVEFAVCLPVIILLVFGAIEASSFIFLKQSLNVAAYEGIRESIRTNSNSSNGLDRAKNILEARTVQDFEISFPNGEAGDADRGEEIVIEVSANVNQQSIGGSICDEPSFDGPSCNGERMIKSTSCPSGDGNCRVVRRHQGSRVGAMLVLILIMMVGFMVAVAFSIDIAQMHLSRTELRTATDAASKAAATTLAQFQDSELAIARGQQIAAANTVNGDPLLLDRSDFTFGHRAERKSGKFRFTAGGTPSNSVLVNGRRTHGSPSGPIPLFFGNVFGVKYFEPTTDVTATYIERDIVLVVDRSGSMKGRKFDDLVNAIGTFTATLDQTPVEEQVGLASYSEFATEDVDLTTKLKRIDSAVAALPVGGYTSISRGMKSGKKIMNRSRGKRFVERTLIVMTDGLHNRGPEPRGLAKDFAADGVTIHTITFGGDADRTRMDEIARIGGGNHYHADNGLELEEVYRQIALTLSTMMTQ